MLCTVCGGKQPVDLLLFAARELHGQPQLLIKAGDGEVGGGLGRCGQVVLGQRAIGGRGDGCQVHRRGRGRGLASIISHAVRATRLSGQQCDGQGLLDRSVE